MKVKSRPSFATLKEGIRSWSLHLVGSISTVLVLSTVTAPTAGGGGGGVATLSSSLSPTGERSRRKYGYGMLGGAGLTLDLTS